MFDMFIISYRVVTFVRNFPDDVLQTFAIHFLIDRDRFKLHGAGSDPRIFDLVAIVIDDRFRGIDRIVRRFPYLHGILFRSAFRYF